MSRKRLELAHPEAALIAIQEQIDCSEDSRYYHRLHALLLLSKGQSCQQVAELLGEDRRTIQRWLKRFEQGGLDGLRDSQHLGRPSSLDEHQWEMLRGELKRYPPGATRKPFPWDGQLLAEHLRVNYGVILGLRQCQRILEQLCVQRRRRFPSILG